MANKPSDQTPCAVELVPVSVLAPARVTDAAIVLALGDLELRIAAGTDTHYVAELVGALRGRC